MNTEWLELHALVDNQLSPEDRARVQESLKSSESAHAEFIAISHTKTLVQEKCGQTSCEEVWRACCKRLDEIDRTKRVEGFVGRYAWAVCSLFICLIIGAAWFNRASGAGLNAGDVAKAASALVPLSAPRSQTTDAKKEWLQKYFDSKWPSQPDMISLVGGATGYLEDGRKITRVDLQDRQGMLRLYMVQSVDRMDGGAPVSAGSQYSAARVNDSNCIAWTGNNRAFVLVGDRPVDQLCLVADQLNSAH